MSEAVIESKTMEVAEVVATSEEGAGSAAVIAPRFEIKVR